MEKGEKFFKTSVLIHAIVLAGTLLGCLWLGWPWPMLLQVVISEMVTLLLSIVIGVYIDDL